MTKKLFKKYAFFLSSIIWIVACGNDSGSSADDSIVSKAISGIAQGPFEKGANVSAYELDNDFQKTGINYESEIENENGEYSIKVKDFESQYALLKAEGYYHNAYTGEKSNEKVTLYALTDLKSNSEININILTHLSYKRAIYLATKKNMTLAQAKKQAETEVLKSFGIEDELDDAENLSITEKDSQSASLLALSVLMQSSIAETSFDNRLADYASDIEEDGVWDDEKTITKIADWTYKLYLNSAFDKVKSYIEKWNSTVNFSSLEKDLNHFWWHGYDLGSCTENRKNEVKQIKKFYSEFLGKSFICRPDIWRTASEKEIDKYFKPDTSKNTLLECTKEHENEILKRGDYYVMCKNKKWYTMGETPWPDQNVDDIYMQYPIAFDFDTLGWKDTTDGVIRKGNATDVIYIFDKTSWRVATLPEASLGKCSKKNLGSAGYAEFRKGQNNIEPVGFKCLAETHSAECYYSDLGADYYKCSKFYDYDIRDTLYRWTATNGKCTLDNYDFKDGKITKWKNGKEGELRWGKVIDDGRDDGYYSKQICEQRCYEFKNGQWNVTIQPQCMGLGKCSDERIGTVVQGPTLETYEYCYRDHADFNICRIKVIRIDSLQKKNYVCRGNFEQDMYDDNKNPLIESMYSHLYWDIANDIDMEMSQSKCSHDGTLFPGKTDSAKIYVCDKAGFREATDDEKSIGLGCTYWTWSSSKTIFLEDSTSYYQCEKDYYSIDDKYFWNLVKDE